MSTIAKSVSDPAIKRRKALTTLAIRVGALAMFLFILGYFAITARGFLNPFNIANVLEQSAILGILAFGMSIVIIGGGSNIQTGGIDLSLAANAGLCAAVFATAANAGLPIVVTILATLGCGMLVGLVNGFAVVGLGIFPLLATLAVMNVVSGVELTITENTVVPTSSPLLMMIATSRFLGISALAWILIGISVVFALIVHRTAFGMRLYAVGGHPEAARAAGLNVGRTVVWTYVIAGLCAGIAAILIVSRLSAASPGTGDMLLAILAASLLGTVFSRRFVATIGGTLLSVIFLGFLANGFQLLNLSSYWVSGVQGVLILIVVAITSFARPPEE